MVAHTDPTTVALAEQLQRRPTRTLHPLLDPSPAPATWGSARSSASDAMHDVLRVASALGDRRLLLVLDTFEQVGEAAPLAGWLLAACPRLSVLIVTPGATQPVPAGDVAVIELPVGEPVGAEVLAGITATALHLGAWFNADDKVRTFAPFTDDAIRGFGLTPDAVAYRQNGDDGGGAPRGTGGEPGRHRRLGPAQCRAGAFVVIADPRTATVRILSPDVPADRSAQLARLQQA